MTPRFRFKAIMKILNTKVRKIIVPVLFFSVLCSIFSCEKHTVSDSSVYEVNQKVASLLRQYGYKEEAVDGIIAKLTPLVGELVSLKNEKHNYRKLKNILLKNSKKFTNGVFGKDKGASEVPPDHWAIYGLLTSQEQSNLVYELTRKSLSPEQESDILNLFACTYHSFIYYIYLKACDIPVKIINLNHHPNNFLKSKMDWRDRFLVNLGLKKIYNPRVFHISLLIDINDKESFFFDPGNHFVTRPFVFNDTYTSLDGRKFEFSWFVPQESKDELLEKFEVCEPSELIAGMFVNLGYVYLDFKEYETALDIMNFAAKLAPKYSGTFNAIGTVYEKRGNYQEAKRYFEKAISLDGDDANSYLSIANILVHTGSNAEEVLQYAEKANLIDPNYMDANRLLGLTTADIGQGDKAVSYLEKAINLRPDLPFAYEDLGDIYFRLKDNYKAREYYEIAVRKFEEHLGGDGAEEVRRLREKMESIK